MAAGYIVAGQCVEASAAVDLFFSSAAPGIVSGSPSYYSQFSKDVSGWSLETYSGGSLVSSAAVVPPSFASCDTTAPFFDGLTLGWGVAAVMVAGYAVHLLRRGLM